MKNSIIDFVIIWVDGNDEKWLKERAGYLSSAKKNTDNRTIRYRDWDNLRYFFRSVEKFAPWVNKIHFVTCGQKPSWLNDSHPKINMVSHEDYIPGKYLPTFNANPIEINLHRINSLAEQFVFFNDDMLIIDKVEPEDFFVDGLPCDIGVMNVHLPDRSVGNHIEVADTEIINDHFRKNEVISNNLGKWFSLKYGKELVRNFCLLPWSKFPGLLHQHLPNSFLKSTFREVWEKEYDVLDETSSHRFRTNFDVNQWLFEDWQRCKGEFHPRKAGFGRSFAITDDDLENEKVLEAIRKRKYHLICFNDMVLDSSFEEKKEKLLKSLAEIFPEKSSYEND